MDQIAMPGTALRFEVDTVFRAGRRKNTDLVHVYTGDDDSATLSVR